MQVNIYTPEGSTPERVNVDLREVCGDDDALFYAAQNELQCSGRYWIGGGAAPFFLLMRCRLTNR